MNPFYRNSENLVPGILLDKERRIFQIYGTSCPLDPFEIYEPVFKWFDEYLKDPLDETILELNLNYFNTASAKFLLRIITDLNKLTKKGKKVKVIWYYSEFDDDMYEEGEELQNMTDADFELVPYISEEESEDFSFE